MTLTLIVDTVRLVRTGPVASEGRLEVRYNGTWGTVCNHSFTDNEARVVCNDLGFGYVPSRMTTFRIIQEYPMNIYSENVFSSNSRLQSNLLIIVFIIARL